VTFPRTDRSLGSIVMHVGAKSSKHALHLARGRARTQPASYALDTYGITYLGIDTEWVGVLATKKLPYYDRLVTHDMTQEYCPVFRIEFQTEYCSADRGLFVLYVAADTPEQAIDIATARAQNDEVKWSVTDCLWQKVQGMHADRTGILEIVYRVDRR